MSFFVNAFAKMAACSLIAQTDGALSALTDHRDIIPFHALDGPQKHNHAVQGIMQIGQNTHALVLGMQFLILIVWISHISHLRPLIIRCRRSQRFYQCSWHMLRSSRRSSLLVTPIVQSFLAQYTIKLVDAETAKIMDEVLCHKRLIRILSLAQQVLAHIGNRLFAQLRPMAQALRMALERWRTAVQQYSRESSRPAGVRRRSRSSSVGSLRSII